MAGSRISGLSAIFDQWADHYDAEYVRLIDKMEDEYVGSWLRTRFPGKLPAFVFDMGCGTGKGCELLRLTGGMYHGIDCSANMLAVAVHRWPKAMLLLGDMASTSAVSNSYALVISLFGSPSYAPFGRVCREAFRLLRPGGYACLMPYAPARLLRDREIQAADYAHFVGDIEARAQMLSAGFMSETVHVRHFSPWYIEDAGEEIIRTELEFTTEHGGCYLMCEGMKP